jgi:hypothetical protein
MRNIFVALHNMSDSDGDYDNQPVTRVVGTISDFSRKEPNKRKLKSSRLQLTSNTNQSNKDNDPNLEGDTQYFDQTLRRMFAAPISNYLSIKNPGESWTKEYVADSDVQFSIERGGKYNKLHAHCIIKIKHYTSLMLDRKKIQQFIAQEMGLPSVHINYRLLKGSDEINIENYLQKYVDLNP